MDRISRTNRIGKRNRTDREESVQFQKTLAAIAVPVTLQNLLQSSFSVVDQIMTGQLGSVSIAGIGLGSKFSSIYSVLVNAVAASAGIMIAQYIGQKDEKEVGRSFCVNLLGAVLLAAVFTGITGLAPERIMGIYTEDGETRRVAAGYLRILGSAYIPMAVSTLFATLLRCRESAKLPLYSSVAAAFINTGLNYLLIFGKLGFPRLEAQGAALATVLSQAAGCVLTVFFYWRKSKREGWRLPCSFRLGKERRIRYMGILAPMIVCEFFWSLGENVYASIYGHMGTAECAAMTLTIPLQVLMTGALGGISQAAGIMVGKSLGSGDGKKAYEDSKRLMIYGFFGSVVCSAALAGFSRWYVEIYQVEETVRQITCRLIAAFALIAPVKIQNMILGGGILRSGGKTTYVMVIDFVGTWFFGVPLGLAAAFLWGLPIPSVYFILSLEEAVRFGISLALFRKRVWMRQLG